VKASISPAAALKLFGATLLLVLIAGCQGSDNENRASSDWRVVMSGQPAGLTSIWGTSAQDIWAVGGDPDDSGSTVMHFNGSAWMNLTTQTTGDLWWVFGFDGGPVFMSGENGLILEYKDGSFERMQTPGTATVYGVWGSSPTDMWAVGGNVTGGAFAWRYDGNNWSEAEGFPPVLVRSASLFKVWGRASDDVWMVGTQGVILHYDGGRITQVASGTERNLFTVNGDGTRIAAVGGFGTGVIVENEGDRWQDVTPASTPHVIGVWLNGDASYAVGIEGVVLRRRNGVWTRVDTGLNIREAFHSVWVDPSGGIWAVGGQVLAAPLVDGVMIHGRPGN